MLPGRVMKNTITVDVEDWQQSTLDQKLPISQRARRNTLRMLHLFREYGVRGTFFIQSLFAESFPEVVERIATDGHEIASHGHSHIPIFKLTPSEFAQDVSHSLQVLSHEAIRIDHRLR